MINASNGVDVGELLTNLVEILVSGLSDDVPTARYAASIGARTFFKNHATLTYGAMLVPAVSLNRFYAAEGVRSTNLETWKTLTSIDPANYLEAITLFCTDQIAKGDGSSKEAACLCLDDVCSKFVSDHLKAIFSNLVDKILHALKTCFDDESWTVRDSAIAACSTIVDSYPSESM